MPKRVWLLMKPYSMLIIQTSTWLPPSMQALKTYPRWKTRGLVCKTTNSWPKVMLTYKIILLFSSLLHYITWILCPFGALNAHSACDPWKRASLPPGVRYPMLLSKQSLLCHGKGWRIRANFMLSNKTNKKSPIELKDNSIIRYKSAPELCRWRRGAPQEWRSKQVQWAHRTQAASEASAYSQGFEGEQSHRGDIVP